MNETDLTNLPPDDPIDILERPIFTVVPDEGPRVVLSLAGLFSRLGHGEPTELAYLMPHQQHVMHAFCVQLAALVCARSGDAKLDRSEAEWREALRALAGSKEAFQLVVGDLSKPAFMQPPVPEGNLNDFKPVATADELDMRVVARNHDLKLTRIRRPRAEHWAFALLSLQTQPRYGGAFNFGIARMNNAATSRAGLGISASQNWSSRFCRDVEIAIDSRNTLLHDPWPFARAGIALVWCKEWDGNTSLRLDALDPLFIEICRRLRMARNRAGLLGMRSGSTARRIEAQEAKGNIGDPWTPVRLEDGQGLVVGRAGFSYAALASLLFSSEWQLPTSLVLRASDGSTPLVHAFGIGKDGQTTSGLHRRTLVLTPAARRRLGTPDGRAALGQFARERIEAASTLRLKVLKPALCSFLCGGADEFTPDDKRPNEWLDRFERDVDAEFFPRLFADIETDADERSKNFETWLVTVGRDLLERAMASLPTPSARRERAVAAAEARFFGGVRKNFQRVELRRPQTTSSQENETP